MASPGGVGDSGSRKVLGGGGFLGLIFSGRRASNWSASFGHDLSTQAYALVADKCEWSSNEFIYVVLRFSAEAAIQSRATNSPIRKTFSVVLALLEVPFCPFAVFARLAPLGQHIERLKAKLAALEWCKPEPNLIGALYG